MSTNPNDEQLRDDARQAARTAAAEKPLPLEVAIAIARILAA